MQPPGQLQDQRPGDAEQAPRCLRRGPQDAAGDDEDVRARPLAQFAPRVGEDRLAGPRLLGDGQGPHVLAVGDRLQPGQGPPLVAGPGHGHHRHRRLRGGRRKLAGRQDQRRRDPAPLGAEGRRPTGHGDAQPGFGEAVGPDHVERRPPQRRPGRDGQPHPRGAAGQALVVAPPAVRLTPVDPQGLEHPVAGQEAVVEGRDAGLVLRHQHAVDPHHQVGHAGTSMRTPAPATARSRAALSSVSRHSAAGSESTVIPPPTPRWVRPATIWNVRMATLRSSAPRPPSIQPTAAIAFGSLMVANVSTYSLNAAVVFSAYDAKTGGQLAAFYCDCRAERLKHKTRCRQGFLDPFSRGLAEHNPVTRGEQCNFPDRHRRDPEVAAASRDRNRSARR